MNTPGWLPFIRTQLSSRLCSFAMNRFSNGYWKNRSPVSRRICGLASPEWKVGCLSPFLTGAALKPTASFCRKRRRIISTNFSARISARFLRFSTRNVLRPVQAFNHPRHASHNLRLFRHAPPLPQTMLHRIPLPHHPPPFLAEPPPPSSTAPLPHGHP